MSDLDLATLSNSAKFLRGARYALAGVRLVALKPGLWGYLVAPAAITISLFFFASFFAWIGVGAVLGWMWTPGPHAAAWVTATWWVFGVLLRAMMVATLALTLYFTAGLIATPFNDRLSDHVETSVLGPYTEDFSWKVVFFDLLNSVSHSVVSLTLWITVMLSAFLLNLAPVVGSVVSFLVGTSATAMFLTRESMDGCMSRRRMSYRHKFRVVASQFWMVMGFGVVVSLMLWIPFLNFLMLPMAVAGGTLMYCHLEEQGLVPDADGKLGYAASRVRNPLLADHEAAADAMAQVRREPERATVPRPPVANSQVP